jgi:hypothetical protein
MIFFKDRLLWEIIGMNLEVDYNLFCNATTLLQPFSCGVLQKLNESTTDKKIYSDKRNQAFCINISDCFPHLPFLCEVNCTNQDTECKTWVKGIFLIFLNIM